MRSVFLIGPDKRIRMMLAYPTETARNFNEILRVIDSLRLTALYNTGPLNANEGVAALPIMSPDKASRGLLGFKALFASLRHENIAILTGRSRATAAAGRQRHLLTPFFLHPGATHS